MEIDWLGALPGAVLGAALTALLGSVVYFWERGKVERAALRELERNLHERRAFFVENLVVVENAKSRPDFGYVAASIRDAREAIRHARGVLVRKRKAQERLTRMVLACNSYLEKSEKEGDRYHFLLDDLRDELHRHLGAMVSKRRTALRPGDGSLPEPVDPRP